MYTIVYVCVCFIEVYIVYIYNQSVYIYIEPYINEMVTCVLGMLQNCKLHMPKVSALPPFTGTANAIVTV